MKKINSIILMLGCIFAMAQPLKAQDDNTGSDSQEQHEWVDLGLPSGLRWATCNIGASSSEQFGNYYAWGETEPKEVYTQGNSLTYNQEIYDIVGDTLYDAAAANWRGEWRLPSRDEMQELIDNCEWEWTKLNGVKGYKLTGPNGNSIFLPAAGGWDGSIFYSGTCDSYSSSYWSGTPYSASTVSSYELYFGKSYRKIDTDYRSYGNSVRPVMDRDEVIETPLASVLLENVTDITAIVRTFARENGAEITERGFYWGIDPTEADNKVVLDNEVGYITTVLELEANTTYYVKAYATNAAGTSYSEVLSFTTLENSAYNDYVDLGLPSGLKWATCNIGATSPEDYGDYYAWGEVLTKDSYDSDNSETYGLLLTELQAQGYIDEEGNLTTAHDVAAANWGGKWRMPTSEEINELINNCEWEWRIQNGESGYKVTGPNGNSIFLPAAGFRGGSSLNNAGGNGRYWSSTPYGYTSFAYSLTFGSGDHGLGNLNRYYGRSVRAVAE